MKEIWARIKDYSAYEVSNSGKIKRISPDYMGRIGLLNPVTTKHKNGYKRIMLYPDRKMFFVHKLVMESFIGHLPKGKQINHKNGTKDDNRLKNLEYCTPRENTAHSIKIGLRNNKGSFNVTSKLKEKDVLKIRKEYLLGNKTLRQLGKKYKVDETNIGHIIRRKTWKHI